MANLYCISVSVLNDFIFVRDFYHLKSSSGIKKNLQLITNLGQIWAYLSNNKELKFYQTLTIKCEGLVQCLSK